MLRFTLDVTTGSLVSWQGGTTSIPAFRQCIDDVELCFVTPDLASPSGAFAEADLTNYLGVRLGLWSNSTGILDDSSAYLLALTPHDQFTLHAADANHPCAWFTGTFNSRTLEIETAISRNKTLAAYFSIGLVRTDLTIEPFLDHYGEPNAVVFSATDDASGLLPVSALPGYRSIRLPVYWMSADGQRTYVMDENETQTGLVFSRFTP